MLQKDEEFDAEAIEKVRTFILMQTDGHQGVKTCRQKHTQTEGCTQTDRLAVMI